MKKQAQSIRPGDRLDSDLGPVEVTSVGRDPYRADAIVFTVTVADRDVTVGAFRPTHLLNVHA